MGTENIIQNLPQELELNDWLKLSLASRNEISRLIALEEMITNGVPTDLNSLLIDISEKDPSQNCRSQAQWLIKLTEAKASLKSIIKKLDVTPNYIKLQIQKKDFPLVSLISQMVRKSPSEQTIGLWREVLTKENEPHLIQLGLELLSKFGEQNDSALAVKHLQSQNPQIICAALSLLAQKDQNLFKKCIRLGLSSKNATVIMHSVHLLRTIDEPEALKYLSVLVLNQNCLVRQKALRELMLVKFEKVENLFWQYIGKEDQAFLLVKAGLLATFNPAPHFPFKIYDIMTTSIGAKKHILQLILTQTIKTTNIAGVLKNKDINTYLNEIKNYIANKKTEQTIRLIISNLKAKEVGIRADAVEKLSKYITHPQIRALLENQLKIETDEGIKSYLSSLFEDATDEEIKAQKAEEPKESNAPIIQKSATALPSLDSLPQEETAAKQAEDKNDNIKSFPNKDEFMKLSAKEQRSLLKKITRIESYPICKNTLLGIIDSNIKKTVLLETLKVIGEFGNTNDAKRIYHLTKSQDYSIAAQTIKSVGAINLDIILPELNKFLAHEDPRIKSAAFDVYAIADKTDAVQYVNTLLRNPKDSVRRMGLSLIPQLDYPSAEPLLWWMLSHETNIELQDQVGYMVAANPTRDGIIKLFEFTHDKNGELREGLAEMWNAALVSAENVLGSSPKELEESCWMAIVYERKEEEKVEKSDYKFKSIVGEKNDIEAEINPEAISRVDDNLLEQLLIHIYQYKVQYISGVCVFCAIFVLIYLNSGGSSNSNTLKRANKHEVVSEANFLSDIEVSDKQTQVGTSDWVGGVKSNAVNILRSPSYAKTISNAQKAQEEYREKAEKLEKEYLEKVAEDKSEPKERRDWAAANINPKYKEAMNIYDSGDHDRAISYLENAADDPNLNSYGKLDAMQKLVGIYEDKNDKANWEKWTARIFEEMLKDPDFKELKEFDEKTGGGLSKFRENMQKIEEVKNALKSTPGARDDLIKGYKSYGYSDEDAKNMADGLMNFKHPFDGGFK